MTLLKQLRLRSERKGDMTNYMDRYYGVPEIKKLSNEEIGKMLNDPPWKTHDEFTTFVHEQGLKVISDSEGDSEEYPYKTCEVYWLTESCFDGIISKISDKQGPNYESRNVPEETLSEKKFGEDSLFCDGAPDDEKYCEVPERSKIQYEEGERVNMVKPDGTTEEFICKGNGLEKIEQPRWRAEKGKYYWAWSWASEKACKCREDNDDMDQRHFDRGDYYHTKEDCEAANKKPETRRFWEHYWYVCPHDKKVKRERDDGSDFDDQRWDDNNYYRTEQEAINTRNGRTEPRPEKKRWEPKEEEIYFYIDCDGLVYNAVFSQHKSHIDNYNFYNTFQTRFQAEKYLPRVKELFKQIQQEILEENE